MVAAGHEKPYNSYVERTGIRPPWPRDVFEAFTENTCFHLFKVNVDGSGLAQLTDGRRNDYRPCSFVMIAWKDDPEMAVQIGNVS